MKEPECVDRTFEDLIKHCNIVYAVNQIEIIYFCKQDEMQERTLSALLSSQF